MKTYYLLAGIVVAVLMATIAVGQDSGGGFVITLKNGSAIRGRTLSRDEKNGKLMLTMTETSSAEAKSYAVIAMDDADSIKASTSDSDSIRIRVKGGSELKCREFALGPDKVTVKLGSRSSVDVPWDQIDSISFVQ
ncbi:MAG TPA: hypothetical protein VLZ81_15585 [Blastocatellia bacterium]|nr:hypothetical protein [Blastocatellia bacterium]